jgi:hypothetical protein
VYLFGKGCDVIRHLAIPATTVRISPQYVRYFTASRRVRH